MIDKAPPHPLLHLSAHRKTSIFKLKILCTRTTKLHDYCNCILVHVKQYKQIDLCV